MSGVGEVHHFSLVDYVLFSISLCFVVVVGFYYACTGGKQKSTSEFLFGDYRLRVIPVVFSLIASSTSAIGVLGFSSEIYTNGAIYSTSAVSIIGSCLATAFLFLPVFHTLDTSSVYEYLQLRFHRYVRRMATMIFVFHNFFYMSMCLYGPSVALSQVTGLSKEASMIGSGLVTTLYSTVGGIKAIVWIDTFQQLLVLVGLLCVIIQGVATVGGFPVIWAIAENGGRTNFFDFNPDPTEEHTTWTIVIGSFFSWFTVFACQQTMVQRYLSIGQLNKAQIGIMSMIPIFLFLQVLYLLAGLVMYAKYADCDPKESHKIENYNQLLPFFVMETLSFVSGLPGVFLAAVYSASMSAISSGLNSIAGVVVEDIINPINLAWKNRLLPDETATIYMKIIACLCGLLTIGLAFLVEVIGRKLYEITIAFDGVFGGPLLGVFCLGIFFPWTNYKGAIISLIISLTFQTWLVIGNFYYADDPYTLPVSTAGCSNMTNGSIEQQFSNTSILTITIKSSSLLDSFYSLAYYHYTFIGAFVCIAFGLGISFLTGPTKFEEIDPKLLHPLFSKCRQRTNTTSAYGEVSQNIEETLEESKRLNQDSGVHSNSNGPTTKESKL